MKPSIIVFAVLCLSSPVLGDDKVAILPVSLPSEARQSEIESIQKRGDNPSVPQIEFSNGVTRTILVGAESIHDHLVRSHNCPQWVVERYRRDAVMLARIHRGYELLSQQKLYSPEAWAKNWRDDPVRWLPHVREQMRLHYQNESAEIGKKFELLRFEK